MKCDRCEETAVYTRRYSGESLCGGCFSRSIQQKTARTISRYGMIRRGESVTVAVSGGKDSLALLHILERMARRGGFTIRAITIDEGIPGYRDEALRIVRDYCGKMGVEYSVLGYEDLYDTTLDEALMARGDGGSSSSCSLCGVLRRRAIDEASKGADVVATAHNLDDHLQTFVINMLSGDTSRIAWMGPSSGGTPRRIKPFCEIYEAEIVFYAFTNGIPFQTEPCPHMNEGIRTPIREFLNSLEQDHHGIKNNLYRSIQRIIQSTESAKQARLCAKCGSKCTGEVCSVCRTIQSLEPNANITRKTTIQR